MMQSRFAKPRYRLVAIDDMNMELVRACRKAQKVKQKVCVVIGIDDVDFMSIPDAEDGTEACSVTASIVWGKNGDRLSAAVVKAMTLVDRTGEDIDEIKMQFASDLVDFLDSYETDISETMKRHFISELSR